MPNYSLVINSQFTPLTYEDFAKPLREAVVEHKALEEKYEKLSEQADILESLAQSTKDAEAYARYKEYSDRLRTAADNLGRYGLSAQQRDAYRGLKTDYNKTIVPIQNAWLAREAENKAQMAALQANPGLVFSRNASDTSLDWYIANPAAAYKTADRKTAAAMLSGMATALKADIQNMDYQALSDKYGENVAGYISEMYHKGYTAEQIINWPDSPVLSAMIDQAWAMQGVNADTWGDRYNDELRGSIAGALWASEGGDAYRTMDNKLWEHNAAMEQETHKAELKGGNGGGGNYPEQIIPFSTRSMPVAVADPETWRDNEHALEGLGWYMNEETGEYKRGETVEISYQYGAVNGSPVYKTENLRVFNEDGIAYSREKFIEQASNYEAKKEAAKYYDDIIKPALIRFNNQDANKIAKNYNELGNISGAGFVEVIDLNTDGFNSTTESISVQKIKRFDKDGKPVFADDYEGGKLPTVGDLVHGGKDNPYNPNNSKVAVSVSNQKGHEGLYFMVDGNTYFVGADTFSDNTEIRRGFALLQEAQNAMDRGDTAQASEKYQSAKALIIQGLNMETTTDKVSVHKQLTPTQEGLTK